MYFLFLYFISFYYYSLFFFFFFFNDTATTEIYTLSLHDALPITTLPQGASAKPSTYLLGVSCRPPGVCLAVGGGRNKAGHSVAMYMVRSGGQWLAAFLAPPPGATTGPREL